MRILHVVESLEVGGLERVVIDLVLQQQKDGHECMVVCLFHKGTLAAELEEQETPVACCDKKPGLDISVIRYLSKTIDSFSSDVVHSHNITSNYYCVLALMTHRGRRLVNTRHGIGRLPGKMKRLFGISLYRTNWVVGVCDQATTMLQELYPRWREKMRTITNGIVLDKHPLRTEANHQQLLRTLNLPEDSLIVSIVARLNPVKNHAMLIEAMAHIVKELPQAHLAIIGDGPTRQVLRNQAKQLSLEDKVLFLGDRRDVPELLAGMDVFVLPSLQEGHSISLLEACAAGLPIVATNVGGNAEIVNEGVNGLLTESGDVQDLTDKLLLLLKNKALREEYGRNSRSWAEKEGSVKTMAALYQDLYTHDA
ncbi:glycosyltransferase [Thiolapillus sp.]